MRDEKKSEKVRVVRQPVQVRDLKVSDNLQVNCWHKRRQSLERSLTLALETFSLREAVDGLY